MSQDKDPLFTVFDATEVERDVALMDRVKDKFGMKHDCDLAEMLGAHKTVLSEIPSYAKAVAAGQVGDEKPRALTALQRLRAFNRLGYAWARDAMIAAFPNAVREELRKLDNERTWNHVVDDAGDHDAAAAKSTR